MVNLLAQLLGKIRFLVMLFKIPKYRRYLLPWLISQLPNYSFRKRIPWLVFDAIKYLDNLVVDSETVFEYGSGASTLYWLKRGARCVSVEHDPKWALKVKKYLVDYKTIDYRVVPPQKELAIEGNLCYDPEAYASNAYKYHNMSFGAYVQQIDEFADGHFDIILIDGRARPSCIQHACCKVKPGGLLIIDDADRDYYYEKTALFLENFEKTSFIGPGPSIPLLWQTDMFIRKPMV